MSGGYLLDTHIWLWALLEPDRLSSRVAQTLVDSASTLYLSPLSLLEANVLAQKGRLQLEPDAVRWTSNALSRLPVREAPVTIQVAKTATSITKPPREPIDRLLVATARTYDLCLVTSDLEILAIAECHLLSNRD